MLRRLGYPCLCLSVDDSSSRGTILRNATPERLRALTEANLARLHSGVSVVLDVLHHRVYAGRCAEEPLPDLMRRAAHA